MVWICLLLRALLSLHPTQATESPFVIFASQDKLALKYPSFYLLAKWGRNLFSKAAFKKRIVAYELTCPGASNCRRCGNKQTLNDVGTCIPCPSSCPECDSNDTWVSSPESRFCSSNAKYYLLQPLQNAFSECPAFCKACSFIDNNGRNLSQVHYNEISDKYYRAILSQAELNDGRTISLECDSCQLGNTQDFWRVSCVPCEMYCVACTSSGVEGSKTISPFTYDKFPGMTLEQLKEKEMNYKFVCQKLKAGYAINNDGQVAKCPDNCLECKYILTCDGLEALYCTKCAYDRAALSPNGICDSCPENCTKCGYFNIFDDSALDPNRFPVLGTAFKLKCTWCINNNYLDESFRCVHNENLSYIFNCLNVLDKRDFTHLRLTCKTCSEGSYPKYDEFENSIEGCLGLYNLKCIYKNGKFVSTRFISEGCEKCVDPKMIEYRDENKNLTCFDDCSSSNQLQKLNGTAFFSVKTYFVWSLYFTYPEGCKTCPLFCAKCSKVIDNRGKDSVRCDTCVENAFFDSKFGTCKFCPTDWKGCRVEAEINIFISCKNSFEPKTGIIDDPLVNFEALKNYSANVSLSDFQAEVLKITIKLNSKSADKCILNQEGIEGIANFTTRIGSYNIKTDILLTISNYTSDNTNENGQSASLIVRNIGFSKSLAFPEYAEIQLENLKILGSDERDANLRYDLAKMEFKNIHYLKFKSVTFSQRLTLLKMTYINRVEMENINFEYLTVISFVQQVAIYLLEIDSPNSEVSLKSFNFEGCSIELNTLIYVISPEGLVNIGALNSKFSVFYIDMLINIENMDARDCSVIISQVQLIQSFFFFTDSLIRFFKSFNQVKIYALNFNETNFINSKMTSLKNNHLISLKKASLFMICNITNIESMNSNFSYSSIILIQLDKMNSDTTISDLYFFKNAFKYDRNNTETIIYEEVALIEAVLVFGNIADIYIKNVVFSNNNFTSFIKSLPFINLLKVTNSKQLQLKQIARASENFLHLLVAENSDFVSVQNALMDSLSSPASEVTQIMFLSNVNSLSLSDSVFKNFNVAANSGIKYWNDKVTSGTSKTISLLNNIFENIQIIGPPEGRIDRTVVSLIVIKDEEALSFFMKQCSFSSISINSSWVSVSISKSSSVLSFESILGLLTISDSTIKFCKKPIYALAQEINVYRASFLSSQKLAPLSDLEEQSYLKFDTVGEVCTFSSGILRLKDSLFKGAVGVEATALYLKIVSYNIEKSIVSISFCSFESMRVLHNSLMFFDANQATKEVAISLENITFANNIIAISRLLKTYSFFSFITVDTYLAPSSSFVALKNVTFLNNFIPNLKNSSMLGMFTLQSNITVTIHQLLMLCNSQNLKNYRVPNTFIFHEKNTISVSITSSKFSQLLFEGDYFLAVPLPENSPSASSKLILDKCVFEYFIVFDKDGAAKALIYSGLKTALNVKKTSFFGNFIDKAVTGFKIVKLFTDELVEITDTSFSNNELETAGIGVAMEGTRMNVSNCLFLENRMKSIYVSVSSVSNKFTIEFTVFDGNIGAHVLQISTLAATVLNSNIFRDNWVDSKSALTEGIDISYEKAGEKLLPSSEDTRLTIRNCSFIPPRAYVLLFESFKKGAVQQISSRIHFPLKAVLFLENNKFVPEQKNLSGVVKGNPARLGIKESSLGSNLTRKGLNQYTLWNQTSREGPSVDIKFTLFDVYNNELRFDELKSLLYFTSNNATNFDLFSPNTETLNKFPSNITTIIFTGAKLMYYEVSIKSSLIEYSSSSGSDFFGNPTPPSEIFTLGIHFRDCYFGEEYRENNLECSRCPYGKYLLSKKTYCDSCESIEGVESCETSKLVLKEGYWRSGPLSDVIAKCGDAPFNCPAGDGSGRNCSEGHVGYLCSECDIYATVWGEAYSKGSKFTCGKCSEISMNALRIVGVSVLTIISLAISVRSTIALMDRLLKVNIIKIFSRNLVEDNTNLGAVYIKIFVNYFQIISSVWSFQIKLPPQLVVLPDMIGSPVEQLFYSVDCFLAGAFNKETLPFIYARLIFIILTPVFYLLIFLFLYFSVSFAFNIDKRLRNSILITSSLFIFLYLQPNVITYAISLLSCIQHEDQFFVRANVSFHCYSPEFNFFSLAMVLPVFLFFSLLFPLSVLLLLVWKRSSLVKSKFRMKFGFLYNEYTQKGFYWEFVKMYQRIIIITILSLLGPYVNQKGLLILLVVFVYGIWAYYIRPYASNDLNELDRKSTISCFYTIFLSLLLFNNNDLFLWISYLCLAIIGIINLKFIYSIVMKIIGQKLLQVARYIDQKKIPIFSRIFAGSIKKAKADIIAFSTAKEVGAR